MNRFTQAPLFNSEEGPAATIKNLSDPSPLDIFFKLFDENIIENLVFQTNLYAQQEGKKYICIEDEIKTFLGINLLMGIKKLPSYRDYWCSDDDLHDPYISKLMIVIRFGWIISHLHSNDNTLLPSRNSPDYDKLYKLRPYLDRLQKNFLTHYNPSSTLAVDESMIKFKGRSEKKQFMPKKTNKTRVQSLGISRQV